jgi:hypothetical protein
MRFLCLSLAIVLLAGNPASATDVCEALAGDAGAAVTLSGVLSIEGAEVYISENGCRMIVSLTPEQRNACPAGAEATVSGEVDFDYGMVTDDLIVYADEITCP